ncbi:MAG: hypothetical protein ABJP48_13650 [Erythrobacter sp.]
MPKPFPKPFPTRKFVIAAALSLGFAASAGLGIATLPSANAQETAPEPDFDFSEPEAGNDAAPEPEVSADMQMVLDEMDAVINALDGDAERNGNSWEFTLEERRMLVVTDATNGRMRVITPIAPVEALPEGALRRLMQANFDTALDARYAVAQNLIWAAFVHPLDTLTTRDFASGLLQTHSLGETFGTTFSSGALNFGGGDSGAIIENQLEELLDQLEERETT